MTEDGGRRKINLGTKLTVKIEKKKKRESERKRNPE